MMFDPLHYVSLIGKTVDEAAPLAKSIGGIETIRETMIDGQPLGAMTMDIRYDRLNVAVRDDIITEVLGIG